MTSEEKEKERETTETKGSYATVMVLIGLHDIFVLTDKTADDSNWWKRYQLIRTIKFSVLREVRGVIG